MKNNTASIIIAILAIICAVLIFLNYTLKKENSGLKDGVKTLTSEKIAAFVELEECLRQNEKFLKKELVDRYTDSLIALRNKVENGYIPADEEIKNFFDRTEFIISNIEFLDLSTEKASQYVYFIESMRNLLKTFSVTGEKTED